MGVTTTEGVIGILAYESVLHNIVRFRKLAISTRPHAIKLRDAEARRTTQMFVDQIAYQWYSNRNTGVP